MNAEASLFHHSPWYVEKVYEEGPGKDSAVFSVRPYSAKPWKQRQLHHSWLPTENLSRLQGMLLPKKANSAPDTNWFLSMQIQTGFFPAALDSLPVHELICPLPNAQPARTSTQYPSTMYWTRWHKKCGRSSSSFQATSQLLSALTATSVFICYSSWLKGSVTRRCPFPS